jgi:hypothetical protein
MIHPQVGRPECGRRDLNYVDSSYFMCGSADLLRIYIYIFYQESCNLYSVCVLLGCKMW